MDMSSRAMWHAGGTCAPLLVKQGGPPTGIWHWYATGVVPLRATGDVFSEAKAQVGSVLHPAGAPSGTQWHGCPSESTRGHGRA